MTVGSESCSVQVAKKEISSNAESVDESASQNLILLGHGDFGLIFIFFTPLRFGIKQAYRLYIEQDQAGLGLGNEVIVKSIILDVASTG